MPLNDINFVLPVNNQQFNNIMLIMLHDACHDFDAGKTDKEFKKLFMKLLLKKAAKMGGGGKRSAPEQSSAPLASDQPGFSNKTMKRYHTTVGLGQQKRSLPEDGAPQNRQGKKQAVNTPPSQMEMTQGYAINTPPDNQGVASNDQGTIIRFPNPGTPQTALQEQQQQQITPDGETSRNLEEDFSDINTPGTPPRGTEDAIAYDINTPDGGDFGQGAVVRSGFDMMDEDGSGTNTPDRGTTGGLLLQVEGEMTENTPQTPQTPQTPKTPNKYPFTPLEASKYIENMIEFYNLDGLYGSTSIVETELIQKFYQYDNDGNGFLNEEELQKLLYEHDYLQPLASEVIKQYDQITEFPLNDFLDWCRENPMTKEGKKLYDNIKNFLVLLNITGVPEDQPNDKIITNTNFHEVIDSLFKVLSRTTFEFFNKIIEIFQIIMGYRIHQLNDIHEQIDIFEHVIYVLTDGYQTSIPEWYFFESHYQTIADYSIKWGNLLIELFKKGEMVGTPPKDIYLKIIKTSITYDFEKKKLEKAAAEDFVDVEDMNTLIKDSEDAEMLQRQNSGLGTLRRQERTSSAERTGYTPVRFRVIDIDPEENIYIPEGILQNGQYGRESPIPADTIRQIEAELAQLETEQSQGTGNDGDLEIRDFDEKDYDSDFDGDGNYKQLYGGGTAEENRRYLVAHTAQNRIISIDPKTLKIAQIINETLNNYRKLFNLDETLENGNSLYKNENKIILLNRIIDGNNDIRTNNIFDNEQSDDSNEIKEALVQIMGDGEVDDWEQNKGAIFQRIGDRIIEIKQIKKMFTSIIRILKSFINKTSYNGIKSNEKINMINIVNNTSEDLYFKHKNIGYLFFDNIIELIIMKNLESFNDPMISENIKNIVRPKVSPSFSTVIPSVPSIIYNLSATPGINFSARREEHLKMLRFITMQDTFLGDRMAGRSPPSTIKQIIEDEINRINNLIINYTSYLDTTDTILTFLDYQRPNFSEKLNFTRTDRQHRKGILDKLIERYRFAMSRYAPPDFDNTNHVFNCPIEVGNIFGPNRPQGGTLDNQLWQNSIHNLTQVDIRTLLVPPNTKYINNAIPNDVRKLLKQLQMTNVICFTSSIDPMGTFGDCAHRDSNDIKEDLGPGKNISVDIYVEDTPGGPPSPLLSDFLKIKLNVQPQGNITVSGIVELKINNTYVIQTNITESNFNKKQPFSIGNTITKLEPLLVNIDKSGQTETLNFINDNDLYKEGDGIKTVFIRKFLGDFLQAIEAIALKMVYLGGDKPAAIMYYYLASLYHSRNPGHQTLAGTPLRTRGGFVPVAGSGDPNVYVWPVAGMGGGGLRRLKDKKRRTNRKRRTNKKRRTNRRKTNKKRKTNRKTNRRKTNRKSKTNNRRRRTSSRRRRSIRKRK